MIINLLLWVLFGAAVGWVASMLMRSEGDHGFLGDTIIGIVGAVIGGFVSQLFGTGGVTGFDLRSFVIALLGALVLISVMRLGRRNRSAHI
jgi:uncharacterized membrane protein YeaQ/YmgE (transglycosylase-associated protein family)